MTARKLLTELEAAGIHIAREGDNLRVRADPGISLGPFIDRIRESKSEIVAFLAQSLQVNIVATATIEADRFDQGLLNGLADDLAREEQLAARLEEGWQRIEAAEAAGQDTAAWTDFWLSLLGEYEALCRDRASRHGTREGVA